MKHELTCIGCPMGCRISAELADGTVTDVSGFSCRIGERYAHEELTAPKRMVTALCPVHGSHIPLAVKTGAPIDKKLIFDCLKAIAEREVSLPVHIGDIIISSVCGTDVDILATQERTE